MPGVASAELSGSGVCPCIRQTSTKRRINWHKIVTVEPLAFFYAMCLLLIQPASQRTMFTMICIRDVSSGELDLPLTLGNNTELNSTFAMTQQQSTAFSQALDNGSVVERAAETLSLNISSSYFESRVFEFCTKGIFSRTASSRPANDFVSASTSKWLMLTNLATNVPGLFTSWLLGAYTDLHNRRRILFQLAFTASCINALIYALVAFSATSVRMPFQLVLVGEFIEGLFGGQALVTSSSFAYVSVLVSNPRARSWRITLMQVVLYAGAGIGTLVSGIVMHAVGAAYVYMIVAVIMVTCCFYTQFWLRELPVTASAPAASTTADGGCTVVCRTAGTLVCAAVRAIFRRRASRYGTARLALLLASAFSFMLVISVDKSLSFLYLTGSAFGLGAAAFGVFNAAVLFVSGVALLAGLPPLQRALPRVATHWFAIPGVIGKMLFLALLGAALSTDISYLVLLVFVTSLQGWTMASLRVCIALQVERNEQTRVFGFLNSSEVLVLSLGSLLFNYAIYPNTVRSHPAAAFYIGAVVGLLALIQLLLYSWLARHKDDAAQPEIACADLTPITAKLQCSNTDINATLLTQDTENSSTFHSGKSLHLLDDLSVQP